MAVMEDNSRQRETDETADTQQEVSRCGSLIITWEKNRFKTCQCKHEIGADAYLIWKSISACVC